jgi:hypothetical protein
MLLCYRLKNGEPSYIPGQGKVFSLPQVFGIPWVKDIVFLEVRNSGNGTDHSPQFKYEVKNA